MPCLVEERAMTSLSDTPLASAPGAEQLLRWRSQLDVSFPQVADVFVDCMVDANTKLSTEGLEDYLAQARFLGKMGRGVEPVLIFLQEWPQIAHTVGEDALSPVMAAVKLINKSPNGKAIAPFLQSKTLTLYGSKGCQTCHDKGYYGRTALFEMIPMTPQLRELLLKNPSSLL